MAGVDVFVTFDAGATPDEVEDVRAAFVEAGVPAVVSDQPYSLVASGAPDLTAGFVVIATTSGLLGAFAGKVGSDAYEALKRLIARLRAARGRDNGRLEIIVRNDSGGPDIVTGPDTPDEELGQLLTSPLPPAPSGSLV